jgi:hypothetical protein
MIDKHVIDCESQFGGIRVGDLVRPRWGVTFTGWRGFALVVDRVLNAMMLGEGDAEHYDPLLVVVVSGRREHVHVDDVEKVEEYDT